MQHHTLHPYIIIDSGFVFVFLNTGLPMALARVVDAPNRFRNWMKMYVKTFVFGWILFSSFFFASRSVAPPALAASAAAAAVCSFASRISRKRNLTRLHSTARLRTKYKRIIYTFHKLLFSCAVC